MEKKAKLFRSGIDAVQLYISLAGLCFFYSANIHTLGILFDRDLRSQDAVRERRLHVIDFVIGYLAKASSAKETRARLVSSRAALNGMTSDSEIAN